MIWAVKKVTFNQARSIETLFREQASVLDSAGKMLLVGTSEGAQLQLWVSVPSAGQLAAFVGFEKCDLEDIPITATLVAGTVNRFNTIMRALKRSTAQAPIEPLTTATDMVASTTEMLRTRSASKRPFQGLTVEILIHKLDSDAVSETTKDLLLAELELRTNFGSEISFKTRPKNA